MSVDAANTTLLDGAADKAGDVAIDSGVAAVDSGVAEARSDVSPLPDAFGASDGKDASSAFDVVDDADALLGAGADALRLWALSRGTNYFKITAVAGGAVDGCMLAVTDLVALNAAPFPVTYTETSTVVSIGNVRGSPPMPALGSGPVSGNMATLTRMNLSGDVTCAYEQKDVSQFVLIGDDKFTLSVTQDESGFGATCTDVPAGDKCTSTWTWTFEKLP